LTASKRKAEAARDKLRKEISSILTKVIVAVILFIALIFALDRVFGELFKEAGIMFTALLIAVGGGLMILYFWRKLDKLKDLQREVEQSYS
jgi:Na+/proline symporter